MASQLHQPQLNSQSYKNTENEGNLKFFNSLEAPLILGVAVVGLLVGCALYHMCYQRMCKGERGFGSRRNRGPSSADIRATTAIVTALFQGDENGRRQHRTVSDDPPEYTPSSDNLLPSYSQALKYPSKKKDRNSQLSRSSVFSSTHSEGIPPAYEESKEEPLSPV